MNTLVHKAQKESVALLVNRIMAEKNPEDRKKTLKRLTTIMETFFGDLFEKESFDKARKLIDEDGKWFQFLNRALDTLNPNVVRTAVMDLGFESGFYGLRTRDAAKAKYHCNIPWAILFDPTSACNLHCIGCWAAEYGHTLNLSYEVMDKIVSQGKEVGCHFYLLTGGEPLVRKADILKLCRKHPDCEFHALTNGTLIDDDFCQEVVKVGNLSFSLSVEGFREVNDRRLRQGHACHGPAAPVRHRLRYVDLLHPQKYPDRHVGQILGPPHQQRRLVHLVLPLHARRQRRFYRFIAHAGTAGLYGTPHP